MKRAVLALALTFAACGSTVDVAQRPVAGDAVAQGSGLEGPDVGVAETVEAAGGPTVSPTRRATTATRAAASPAGAPATNRVLRTGRGVTDKEIRIGVTVVENGGTFAAAIGVPANFGDGHAQVKAVVDHINKGGGIAGRQVKPVTYIFDAGNFSVEDGAAEQRACAHWTEDNEVFAAINTVLAREILLTCLAKKGVPSKNDQLFVDQQLYNETKDAYYSGGHIAGLMLDRSVKLQMDGLAAAGFFGKGAKAAIIFRDIPTYRRVLERSMIPALARHGVPVAVTEGAPGFVEAPYATYALRFQQAGVTHVFFLGEAGGYPLLFTQAAESQGYRPFYGLRTDNLPQVVKTAAPPQQLQKARGIGWSPIIDVDEARDPKGNPAADQCLDIMRKANVDMGTREAQGAAFAYCEGFFLIERGLESGVDLTLGGLAAGIGRLGTSFQSPLAFGTRYAPDRHDGVAAYRDFAYDTACSCFSYVSPVKRVP